MKTIGTNIEKYVISDIIDYILYIITDMYNK